MILLEFPLSLYLSLCFSFCLIYGENKIDIFHFSFDIRLVAVSFNDDDDLIELTKYLGKFNHLVNIFISHMTLIQESQLEN